MLLSMTGQGQAMVSQAGNTVQAEVRSVNNRFLKVTVRCGELFNELAPRIERVLQTQVRRGSVNVNLRVSATSIQTAFRLNREVFEGYQRQLVEFMGESGQTPPMTAAILGLPGVSDEGGGFGDQVEELWPLIEKAVSEAAQNLNKMRAVEGSAMRRDLVQNLDIIARRLQEIECRAPVVSQAYQQRILDRIQQILTQLGGAAPSSGTVWSNELVREVAVYADRCDFSEEVVRLRSHLEQFAKLLQDVESQGRKMDFLIQEMVRETNTIGSKGNDAEIAGHVVEIKTCIERMREMVQNIE
ncbi:MAG: YicC family protein [Planctomycetaceae bacterium]|nr:YicC family protein [Planctomycetaceae bacterium]